MTPADHVEQPTAEDLWRQFESSLRGFVRRRVADPHRVDDVVSEVFVRIQRGLRTVEDDERVAGWVFAIARNAVVDEYRRTARRQEDPVGEPSEDLFEPTPLDIEEPDALAELASCIRPLLRYLPEHHRRALELSDLQGISQVDAAGLEGISVSGMKSRVQRGRRELRALLDRCCDFTLDGRGLPLEFTPVDCACDPEGTPCLA